MHMHRLLTSQILYTETERQTETGGRERSGYDAEMRK